MKSLDDVLEKMEELEVAAIGAMLTNDQHCVLWLHLKTWVKDNLPDKPEDGPGSYTLNPTRAWHARHSGPLEDE